jgi:hypothetical protein
MLWPFTGDSRVDCRRRRNHPNSPYRKGTSDGFHP